MKVLLRPGEVVESARGVTGVGAALELELGLEPELLLEEAKLQSPELQLEQPLVPHELQELHELQGEQQLEGT